VSQKIGFLQLLVCTACCAAAFGAMASCGTNQMQSTTQASQSTIRLLSHTSPAHMAWSHFSAKLPLIAMIFQTPQPQGAQIQQSFEGLSCSAFQPGVEVNFNHAASGFIPILVLGDSFIEPPAAIPPNPPLPEESACAGVFAQVGGGTDLIHGGTLTNPGAVIYTGGTLSTLIVTGITLAGRQIRCSDTTATASVHDLDLVQPYFQIQTNSVVLAIGTNQLPFTCQLDIPNGDSAGSLAVNWVKM
jgi:hypothetical protein